jgi:hypothetical protein
MRSSERPFVSRRLLRHLRPRSRRATHSRRSPLGVRRLRTSPVTAKRWVLSFVAVILVVIAVCAAYLTFGGAGWQIRRHFPNAEVFFGQLNSPDPTFTFFARILFPRYVHPLEPVGIRLADHPHPVDLSRLAGLRLHTVWLTRCKITDLRTTESAGLHPFVHFTDCDVPQLPPDRRHLIRPYDPKDPAAANQLYHESPANIVPSLDLCNQSPNHAVQRTRSVVTPAPPPFRYHAAVALTPRVADFGIVRPLQTPLATKHI